MLFNSYQYLIFLPIVLGGFWLLAPRFRTHWLLAASYLFYGAWDVRFLGLLVLSTLIDFRIAKALENKTRATRRNLLLIALTAQLVILGLFKYWGFFVESAQALASEFGLTLSLPVLQIVLPVGISFYTFQTMAYTIDVYRGRLQAERSLVTFALYVAFFPQLVAGPIERAQRLLPQLRRMDARLSSVGVGSALVLIGVGLFKKVAIADAVAPFVNGVFANSGARSSVELAAALVGFGLQIYGDFSGYSDIARGSARLMGVELMDNFAQPYLSASVTEFWRRWHISFSTWLRDYLYIPLGGNRQSPLLTYRNLMLTMLLGGLWHGAKWTFVVWGGLHGLYLALERLTGRGTRVFAGWKRRVAVGLTLVLVLVTWIPFRAATLREAVNFFVGLVNFAPGAIDWYGVTTVLLASFLAYAVDSRQRVFGDNPVGHLKPIVRGLAYGSGLVALLIFSSPISFPFIYFQF
ncbi:MAG: MBOAT family O-acyltransferase [Acidimicrobiia bacterium]